MKQLPITGNKLSMGHLPLRSSRFRRRLLVRLQRRSCSVRRLANASTLVPWRQVMFLLFDASLRRVVCRTLVGLPLRLQRTSSSVRRLANASTLVPWRQVMFLLFDASLRRVVCRTLVGLPWQHLLHLNYPEHPSKVLGFWE